MHHTQSANSAAAEPAKREKGGVMWGMWADMTAQVCPPDIIDRQLLMEETLSQPLLYHQIDEAQIILVSQVEEQSMTTLFKLTFD